MSIRLNVYRFPGAEWATSKGGHAFLWEFPKPFNKKVLGFIGKHR